MNHYAVTVEYYSESGNGPYRDTITYPNCTLNKDATFTRTKRIPTIQDGKIVMTEKQLSVLNPPTSATEEVKIIDIELQKHYFHVD